MENELPTLFPLINVGMELFFYVLFLIFVIYSTILAYHWLAYGTERSTGIIALAIYLIGGAPFLIVMSVTF